MGFVGPAATAPIPRDTIPPAAPQNLSVATPSSTRTAQVFDVRWRNIVDGGSPIDTAHYQVVNAGGGVLVPTKTIKAANVQAIESIDTPRERGAASLRLWLSDAEGNVGAPVTAPLAYDCVRSDVVGGLALSAGLGKRAEQTLIVKQGEGSTVAGKLQGAGQLTDAPICVYARVITQQERQFLGVAMTASSGAYNFALEAGPSREVTVVHRPGQREASASATLQTRVRPTFNLQKKVVRNKSVAVFTGSVPGPDNEKVLVVLQVKDGKHWRVFRRYSTGKGGKYVMRYRFTQTRTPTTYLLRAQVPDQGAYPFEGGNSLTRKLIVMP